jgi:hypothetical protein
MLRRLLRYAMRKRKATPGDLLHGAHARDVVGCHLHHKHLVHPLL